jgi:hypothetical protein
MLGARAQPCHRVVRRIGHAGFSIGDASGMVQTIRFMRRALMSEDVEARRSRHRNAYRACQQIA